MRQPDGKLCRAEAWGRQRVEASGSEIRVNDGGGGRRLEGVVGWGRYLPAASACLLLHNCYYACLLPASSASPPTASVAARRRQAGGVAQHA